MKIHVVYCIFDGHTPTVAGVFTTLPTYKQVYDKYFAGSDPCMSVHMEYQTFELDTFPSDLAMYRETKDLLP